LKLRVLSHAGLEVETASASLVCDPWIIGSVYWRSWWNYPPVAPGLVESLDPDAIYLTHIHWDHFQGISLRKLGKEKKVVIPKEPCGRMKRDLLQMGFANVVEIDHAESLELAKDLKITSYHFGPYLDSVVVIEAEGHVICNANDAKLMGGPLRQLLARHPRIDFVLRSHSSANSRMCYEIIDAPETPVDDFEAYTRNFADFAVATGARYAIPFASNHCHLHRDTFRFNDRVTTPLMVERYFAEHGIEEPQLKVMVSGDYFSDEEGFVLQQHDYFTNREVRLREYRDRNAAKLEQTYEREARAKVRMGTMRRYFDQAFAAMPWVLRVLYRNDPVLYVLRAGEEESLFEVDFYRKQVREVEGYTDESHPIQVHIPAAVMRHCLLSQLFAHLGASHRVRYRVRSDKRRLLVLLTNFYQAFEYEVLPLHQNLNARFLSGWLRRWREIPLYFQIAGDVLRGRSVDYARHVNGRVGAHSSNHPSPAP